MRKRPITVDSWRAFLFVGLPVLACGFLDAADWKSELARPVVDSQTALDEVQRFVEAAIPRVPHVKSAEEWSKRTTKWRQQVLDHVVFRGEAAAWRNHPGSVVNAGEPIRGPGYVVQKLRYECLPGMWIPALLYLPDKVGEGPAARGGKVPVVLNVNGHDKDGKAADYKQMRCINLVKRGCIVLNPEWFGMGQLRSDDYAHTRMNQLDLCGTSGIAPFYLAMSKGLDLLLKQPQADPQRVAVSGLSGGGWQTIFISGLDPRVTLANPVAGYSSYLTRARNGSDLGDSEQTPCDLGKFVDYAHLTAMRAPAPTLLTFNAHDNCCFAAGHALPPLLATSRPVYGLFGKTDYLLSHVNHVPGDHNFGQDNREAFYRAIGTFFFDGSRGFDPREIPNEPGEVKSLDDLRIPVPDDNATFSSLAKSLAAKLPREDKAPADAKAKLDWQTRRRKQLAQLVAAIDFHVVADEIKLPEPAETSNSETSKDNSATEITRWRLRLGRDWTVPVIELTRGKSKSTSVIVADAGRVAVADEIDKLLAAGERVLAVDPLSYGDLRIKEREWLWDLMLDTVGQRPIGLQASQLAAITHWAHDTDHSGGIITLRSVGPRSSLATLIAAILEPQAVGRLVQRDAINSLKQFVIEDNRVVSDFPELFCFGLLEQFDVPQLRELIAPRHFETNR